MEYAQIRKAMVEEQLVHRGIKDQRVLDAFLKVERHKFVPEESISCAYIDHPVSIGHQQTISQPYIAALMSECLNLTGSEKVLEVGTGSGYQTAILAELAKEVHSIERIEDLAKRAEQVFLELNYRNIKLKIADGSLGWPEEAPFDRIILTAAAPRIPLPLIDQLKENGKLLLPLGEEGATQVLTLVEKKDNKLVEQRICDCVFVPLIGKYGCYGRNN